MGQLQIVWPFYPMEDSVLCRDGSYGSLFGEGASIWEKLPMRINLQPIKMAEGRIVRPIRCALIGWGVA